MATMTITEALAETKTIAKRIASKREAVLRYLTRQEYQKDPLADSGGSAAFIASERQAIADLETRLVAIRTGVQRKNLDATITVLDVTKTVAEWLAWRRDVSAGSNTFTKGLMAHLGRARNEARAKGVAVVPAGGTPTAREDLLVNVDEGELNREVERVDEMLATLDGRLSLANATLTIDV